MSSSNFKLIFKKVIVILLILVVMLAIFGLGKQIIKTLQASRRLDEAANHLSKLQQDNRKLQQELLEAQQSGFIEKIARNKLLMARPNETIVVIPEEEVSKVLGEAKKEVEVVVPNWQGWWKLFFK